MGSTFPITLLFEAINLNTLPIRKRHPLYTDAIHSKHFLSEMAAQVKAESLPIYLMHDSNAPTPFGRVFYAEVVDTMGVSELRTLFWVDQKSHADVVEKVDNGTVDQVSVSVLPKSLACSECGFDFLGDSSDLFDNVLSGTCDKGHIMGEDGAHAVSQNLDSWFEMSLVGRGGARGARILSRDEQRLGSTTFPRLAASGVDLLSIITLVASAEPLDMELIQLIAELADTRQRSSYPMPRSLSSTVRSKPARLRSPISRPSSTLPLPTRQLVPNADVDAALGALRDVTKKVLIASGKVDAQTEDLDVAACVATIPETSASFSPKLIVGGKSKEATADADKAAGVFSGAFRTRS